MSVLMNVFEESKKDQPEVKPIEMWALYESHEDPEIILEGEMPLENQLVLRSIWATEELAWAQAKKERYHFKFEVGLVYINSEYFE